MQQPWTQVHGQGATGSPKSRRDDRHFVPIDLSSLRDFALVSAWFVVPASGGNPGRTTARAAIPAEAGTTNALHLS